jgi:hypothetical protein
MRERDFLPRNWRLLPPKISDDDIRRWAYISRVTRAPASRGAVGNVMNPAGKRKRKARITLAKVMEP